MRRQLAPLETSPTVRAAVLLAPIAKVATAGMMAATQPCALPNVVPPVAPTKSSMAMLARAARVLWDRTTFTSLALRLVSVRSDTAAVLSPALLSLVADPGYRDC